MYKIEQDFLTVHKFLLLGHVKVFPKLLCGSSKVLHLLICFEIDRKKITENKFDNDHDDDDDEGDGYELQKQGEHYKQN